VRLTNEAWLATHDVHEIQVNVIYATATKWAGTRRPRRGQLLSHFTRPARFRPGAATRRTVTRTKGKTYAPDATALPPFPSGGEGAWAATKSQTAVSNCSGVSIWGMWPVLGRSRNTA
jgi:hypothetical protein